MPRTLQLQRGQAMLVATIFFLVVSVTIILGLTGPIVREQKIATDALFSRQSYYAAESGIEDVIYRLNRGYAVSPTQTLNLNGFTATTITTSTTSGKEITASGTAATSIRQVVADVQVGDGVFFHYGIQVGTGGFILSNNAGVIGNVYANGSITGSNGAYITGDALAGGTISNVAVSGRTQTGMPPQDFPITDAQIADWKADAATGGTVGSQTLSGTNNSLGPMKINGNLTLGINAQLTVTGTLWVTGNLTLSNGSSMALASGYGTSEGGVIVDGLSSLQNNSTFAGSGSSSSYLMIISTNAADTAIALANNAGAVILYAPYGTVALQNGADVAQITAKTISLANNAVITYHTGLINAAFSSGPGGAYQVTSWKEVE